MPNACVRQTKRGFTLLELLLVTALVASLAAALVFSFTGLMRNAQLDEGAGRIESLVRFARAQAANTGRKVQLVFEPENAVSNAPPADVKLTWEPDPIGRPGQFEDLGDITWQAQGIRDLVQVANVQLRDHCKSHDPNERPGLGAADESKTDTESTESFSPITFYPDGTSDSAEIILASVGPEEEQRMSLRIVGITGSISRRALAAETSGSDLDAHRSAAELGTK